VLHPLTRHQLQRVRHSTSRRALHHLGLFLGFLLTIYVVMLLLNAVYALLAPWF
jgi:hypothetical protein